jgi:hypothetical protein
LIRDVRHVDVVLIQLGLVDHLDADVVTDGVTDVVTGVVTGLGLVDHLDAEIMVVDGMVVPWFGAVSFAPAVFQ